MGDDNFNTASTSAAFTVIERNVTKMDTSIDIGVESVENDATITVNVNENATGLVELNIDGVAVYLPVNNGQVTGKFTLASGDYIVTATYLGDAKFNGNSASERFTIKSHVKKDTPISAAANVDGSKVILTVNVDSNATGYVLFEMNNYNISVAVKDGKAVLNYITEPGKYNLSATYLGDDAFNTNTTQIVFTVKSATSITASKVTATYGKSNKLTLTLKDVEGNPLSGKNVTVKLNGKTYNGVTNSNGQYSVAVPKNLVPKTYTAYLTFKGDDMYVKSTGSAVVKVVKAASKITAKKKTFKKSIKVKKYSITLKSGKTPIKKVKVTLKIKGKTYKAKTNAKGKATFKIKKLTKKGKYTAVIKFNGNKYYKVTSKKVKITIK